MLYIKYQNLIKRGSFSSSNMWNWFRGDRELSWQEESWKQKIHTWFVDWFYSLTEKKGFRWLDLLVTMLCVLEVNFKLYKNRDYRDAINVADMTWEEDIPKDTFYCQDCKYKTRSKIARLFYGTQMDGFCYYLNRGDFTYGHYTDILWDGCKCCGIHEGVDDEHYESLESIYNYDDSIEP